MPKAGSTSIQLALRAAQEPTLTPNGIWFRPLDGAFNDCVIYDMLIAQDLQALDQYAKEKIHAAANTGADVVIFSAERLFTLDQVKERTAQLGRIMQTWAAEVSFAVVVRDLAEFLRSYITQMIYNADVTLEDNSLAAWVIGQMEAISDCGFQAHFIGLDAEDRNRNIAERLVRVSAGRELDIPLERANITPSRPLIYALAEGLVARIHAIDSGGDVNATGLDAFRTDFATAYDDSVYATSDPGEVYRVLKRLNQIIEDEITEYIDRCLQACPPERLAFYKALVPPTAGDESPASGHEPGAREAVAAAPEMPDAENSSGPEAAVGSADSRHFKRLA